MAKSGAIRAGRAFVELGVDDRIQAGLNRAAQKFRAFGAVVRNIGATMTIAIASIGAAITATLVPLAKFSDEYQNILNRVSASNDEAAKSTQVLIDTTNELFGIAKRARAPIGSLAELYSRLALGASGSVGGGDLLAITETIAKASTIGGGTQESVDAALVQLSQILGAGGKLHSISAELNSLREQTPFLFKTIATGLGRIGVSASGTTAELRELAKSGELTSDQFMRAILAMSNDVENQFERIAPTISQSFTVMRNSIVKSLGEFSHRTGFGREVAGIILSIADSIGVAARAAEPFVTRIMDWVSANRELVSTIAKIVAFVAIAGVSITALGLSIQLIGVGIAGISALIGVLTSPITIVTAAIGGLITYFLFATDAGEKTLGFLSDKFQVFRDAATEAIGAVGDALASGDLALAANILWTSLKIAWMTGTEELQKIWIAFRSGFLKVIFGAVYGAQAAWSEFTNAIEVGWIETVSLLGRTWTQFTSGLKSVWEITQNWLEKRWLDLFGLFDEGFDVDAAKSMADQASNRELERISAAEQQAVSENRGIRDQQRAAQDAEFKAQMASIGQKFNDIADSIDQNASEDLKAAREELKKLITEFHALREQARQQKTGMSASEGTSSSMMDPKALTNAIAESTKNIAARGTFSPFSVGDLGAPSELKRIADATNRTAQNTDTMATLIQGGALEPTFG